MLNKHYPPRKPVGSVCGYFSPEKFLLSRFWPDTCGKQLLTSSSCELKLTLNHFLPFFWPVTQGWMAQLLPRGWLSLLPLMQTLTCSSFCWNTFHSHQKQWESLDMILLICLEIQAACGSRHQNSTLHDLTSCVLLKRFSTHHTWCFTIHTSICPEFRIEVLQKLIHLHCLTIVSIWGSYVTHNLITANNNNN